MAEKEVQNSKKGTNKVVSASKVVSFAPSTSLQTVSAVELPVITTRAGPSSISQPCLPGPSHSQTSSSNPHSKDGLTKEVLLILQELNRNVKNQNERIEKLENSYYEDDEFYGDDGASDQSFDRDIQIQDHDSNQSSDSPICSSKDDVFRNLMEKFQHCDIVDKSVNTDLAQFVNNSFRNGLSEDKINELLKDLHRPENCDALVKTRVNQGIWRLLKASVQYDDNKLQGIQEIVVKAASNITKSVDMLANLEDPVSRSAIGLSTDAIALLGQANKNMNIRRKELHKSSLDPKYHYLASPFLPYTDFLYGDDNDVNKNVKEINDLNKIGRIGQSYGLARGREFRRPHPYRQRGRGRGRGDGSASKNGKTAGLKK